MLRHSHTVSMGSWTLNLTLVGASLWLLLWMSLSLLFTVFSDVSQSGKGMNSLAEGALKEQETESKKLNGLDSSFPQCVTLVDSDSLALQSDGDVVIGGVFPLHYVAPEPQHSYSTKPQLIPCSG